MDAVAVDKAAGGLLEAYTSGIPVPPLTASDPGLSVADPYAIQLAQVAAWTDGGAAVRGHGVGLTSAAMPALKIIDSRIADWNITLAGTVADNASSGAVVLGSWPARPDALDLSLTGCLLQRNGRLESTGAGGAVLGSPVNALVWLANTLGVSLDAGHVVLPGSLTGAIPFGPGDTVSAAFDRIGAVSIIFSQE